MRQMPLRGCHTSCSCLWNGRGKMAACSILIFRTMHRLFCRKQECNEETKVKVVRRDREESHLSSLAIILFRSLNCLFLFFFSTYLQQRTHEGIISLCASFVIMFQSTEGNAWELPICLFCSTREYIFFFFFHITNELTRGIFCCLFVGYLC